MPKKVKVSEIEEILNAVKKASYGASIEELASQLSLSLPRRTLQRRLAMLVHAGHLVTQGKGRAVRYIFQLHSTHVLKDSEPDISYDQLSGIQLSTQSKEIMRQVQQPLQKRKPVGYQREFLDRYRPNVSYYLPQSVREHLEKIGRAPVDTRPAGTHAKQVLNRLLIDLSWNSSRLEGNTYSLLETERLIELGESAEGKDAIETQMLLNHKAAIEFLVDMASDIGINRYTLLNLHTLLADNLLSNPAACGRLRNIPVGITKTSYHPLEVPQLVSECFDQIIDTAAAITHPFEQAFFLMIHLPYLQPFEDVNKRVSRLAANIPFIQKNYSPLSFIDVPEKLYIDGILGVYELNQIDLLRDMFVWAYERSAARYAAVQQSLGEPDLFQLKHRIVIAQTVKFVVEKKFNKKEADLFIKEQASLFLPQEARARFVEVVEIALCSLHEGNIARYRIIPAEYDAWYLNWR